MKISATTPTRSSSSRPSSPSDDGSSSPYRLIKLPWELQLKLLTYLRAYDLSSVQQTCRYYGNPRLADAIVRHAAERVYTPDLTQGFERQPTLFAPTSSRDRRPDYQVEEDEPRMGATSAAASTEGNGDSVYYTFEHLRNMELVVVARVLSRPEPASGRGFVVSKSWCKAALRWLEVREQQVIEQQQKHRLPASQQKKKKNKVSRKQRVRNRKLSDASPPWPNVNSDLLCEHQNLQYCLSKKSARARRKILDRQAWKILKTLYPDSNELDASCGECLQCALVAETEKNSAQERIEQEKLQRKMPLNDPVIRQFYTRTRGAPAQALRSYQQKQCDGDEEEDRKLPATSTSSRCPLQDGVYYVLPRAWCHGWRRYIKTGEGGTSKTSSGSSVATSYPPPDAASLLCDAHRLPLIPPHLEAYLQGYSPQLLFGGSTTESIPIDEFGNGDASTAALASPAAASLPSIAEGPTMVPGQAPDASSLEALQAAGLSEAEVLRQLSAMRMMEQQRASVRAASVAAPANDGADAAAAAAAGLSWTNNEALDRENHSVVEIVTRDEFRSLERCWPGSSLFCVSFEVRSSRTSEAPCGAAKVAFLTPPCRECDPTGRQDSCSLSIKNRARGWVRKSTEKARAPASLEY